MSKENRFYIKEKDSTGALSQNIRIIVDKQTGVNYMWVSEGYAGGLTPLLDSEGKPIISK